MFPANVSSKERLNHMDTYSNIQNKLHCCLISAIAHPTHDHSVYGNAQAQRRGELASRHSLAAFFFLIMVQAISISAVQQDCSSDNSIVKRRQRRTVGRGVLEDV